MAPTDSDRAANLSKGRVIVPAIPDKSLGRSRSKSEAAILELAATQDKAEELLETLHNETEKVVNLLRRNSAFNTDMRNFLIETQKSQPTEEMAEGLTLSSDEHLDWAAKLRRFDAVGLKYASEDSGFFRYLPARDDEEDVEEKAYYFKEERPCGNGDKEVVVKGPWTRAECFKPNFGCFLLNRFDAGELQDARAYSGL